MKFYEIKKYLPIILLIIIHFTFISCSSPKQCMKIDPKNNLPSIANTNYNELSPFFLNNNFYFVRQSKGKKQIDHIFEYNLEKKQIVEPKIFELNGYNNPSNFSFYQAGDTIQVFFAATVFQNKIPNRDIFQGKIINNDLTDIAPIAQINTDNFEAYPMISKDGRLLVFVSDRTGGIGGTDLYLSIKKENGEWSEPINFGDKINTPVNEISPFLDDLDNLYFSSNGFDNKEDFNIIKSEYSDDYQWELARTLPTPINTDSDEITPFIHNNQIYYASNRAGGCGGFDLYANELCGKVFLTGQVFDSQNKLPLQGVLNLYDNSGNLISENQIGDNGKFSMNLNPNSSYTLEYYNTCVPLYTPRKSINTPCNEEEITQITLPIELRLESKEYEFQGVVPFFVSGYYKPNTPNELQNLRLLFANNILGIADSNKYIEYPDAKYDAYSETVQEGLNSLVATILEILRNSKSKCNIDVYEHIKISIQGFADERGFSDFAKYSGEDITDPILGKVIPRGTKMDNDLLGLLRGYFTYKFIETQLSKDNLYQANSYKIIWDISSGGVTTDEDELILKRKVKIIISTQ